jgi:glyoxylase-like metal-dependent hydrolase (beta-lactamase superfamily II)
MEAVNGNDVNGQNAVSWPLPTVTRARPTFANLCMPQSITSAKNSLKAVSYPLGEAMPTTGGALTLRPGLHWVRMPLPFALNHINLWALDDQFETRNGTQASWSVVDTGVATETIREAWRALFAGRLAGRPLSRVLVTHMHPDHVGNAEWLIQHFSLPEQAARLWMSAADYSAAQLACLSTSVLGGERAATFFMSHGLNQADDLNKIRARGGYFAALVPELPRAHRRLMDGMTVRIGERDWRCMVGHGHCPEHIALFNECDGLLISGDMLLPRISTNVSVLESEPEADALGLFLASLDRMRALPEDTLALPSHGLPFTGIHVRIQQLHDHHAERLDEVLVACTLKPSSAAEMLPVLFKRPLDLHQTTFAMGESVAHLNHLWHQGVLQRAMDDEGVWRFSSHRH